MPGRGLSILLALFAALANNAYAAPSAPLFPSTYVAPVAGQVLIRSRVT